MRCTQGLIGLAVVLLAVLAAVVVLGLTSSAALAEVRYTVTGLGTLGGSFSGAFGINDAGQVVGRSYTPGGYEHAFLFTPGSGMTDLGTFGGGTSEAYSINNLGQVVGYADTATVGYDHAFLYTPGSGLTDLGTLGGAKSWASCINNAGQIVGGAQKASGDRRAFLYKPGSGMMDLGTLGGPEGWANGINDAGQVVGSTGSHAFLYTPGSGMTDLGTLGGASSRAYGINDLGQVVGSAYTGSKYLPCLYSGGAVKDLNSLIDPASGWTLSEAMSINDGGQIAGYGLNPSGQWEAFLLTPIPEPATLALLAAGAAAPAARRRRA